MDFNWIHLDALYVPARILVKEHNAVLELKSAAWFKLTASGSPALFSPSAYPD